MRPERLPPGAYAAALACLPGAGPGWLVDVIGAHGPQEAWELATVGELPTPRGLGAAGWPLALGRLDVSALWERAERLGITVTWPGAPGYPAGLAEKPAPAGVLFVLGDPGLLDGRPAVAIIGTRQCTPEGASVAHELGYDLAAAGACVISGLALGIDGAAHAGALAAVGDQPKAATTVGIAASGVDIVYPRQHTALWREVARLGAVVSEVPPGFPAQSWRFPSRNRLIAGLSRMVVVVESHASGGSWHTVEAAARAGVDVGAVPGSVRSPASAGTNMLLHEGAVPVRHAEDVLSFLGLSAGTRAVTSARAASMSASGDRTSAGPLEAKVLEAIGWSARCLDEVVERSGLPLGAAVLTLEKLEGQGEVRSVEGWWSRCPRRPGH